MQLHNPPKLPQIATPHVIPAQGRSFECGAPKLRYMP